MTYATELYVVT